MLGVAAISLAKKYYWSMHDWYCKTGCSGCSTKAFYLFSGHPVPLPFALTVLIDTFLFDHALLGGVRKAKVTVNKHHTTTMWCYKSETCKGNGFHEKTTEHFQWHWKFCFVHLGQKRDNNRYSCVIYAHVGDHISGFSAVNLLSTIQRNIKALRSNWRFVLLVITDHKPARSLS